jgi:hypothetical protein
MKSVIFVSTRIKGGRVQKSTNLTENDSDLYKRVKPIIHAYLLDLLSAQSNTEDVTIRTRVTQRRSTKGLDLDIKVLEAQAS